MKYTYVHLYKRLSVLKYIIRKISRYYPRITYIYSKDEINKQITKYVEICDALENREE